MHAPVETRGPEAGLSLRQQQVANYMERLPVWEQAAADAVAADITPGGMPLAKTVVIVPVAAHQEAAQIRPALGEYARQRTNTPFTVVLGLNCPAQESDSADVRRSVDAVEEARAAHPGLDVRTTFKSYGKPVIGRIRRDLWNGVAEASLHGAPDMEMGGDTIGINHDIDLIWLDPRAIGNIQQHYRQATHEDAYRRLDMTTTSMRHGISPGHPNVSRAVAWYDYAIRAKGNYFEEGVVIPLTGYAREGGFDHTLSLREMHGMTGGKVIGPIKGTDTVTSPRRFVQHMGEHGYDIWDTGTFSPTDECRANQDFPDIERGQLEEVIGGALCEDAYLMMRKLVRQESRNMNRLSEKEPELFQAVIVSSAFFVSRMQEHANRISITGSRILDKVLGLPSLAQRFEQYINPNSPQVKHEAETAYEVLAQVRGIIPRIV